ncbi:hypothetical protein EG329_006352 [Mollisiaceae sp. DMI_Dod_QoI]|nr:hypothetical protein EG329_006352 [Helotiales sp. DMI_Dod_QoI]
MSRCTISKVSSTAKGLTTVLKAPASDPILDLLSRWKPSLHNAGENSYGEDTPRSTSARPRTSDENVCGDDRPPSQPSFGNGQAELHGDTGDVAREVTSTSASQLLPLESSSAVQQIPALPISPLMDSSFLQAKKKHQVPKQPPSELRSLLQQELAKNPFALALASPVRRCGLTETALPRYFLQDFHMLAHPTTSEPYFLPISLTRKSSRAKESAENTNPIGGATGYTLANKHTLASILSPNGPHLRIRGGRTQRAHHKLVPQSFRTVKPAMKMLINSRWRPDMESFVLELMRRRCMEHLVDLRNLKRGYLVGCANWEDAASKPSVAAFLWTGGDAEVEPDNQPIDYSTLDLGMEGGLTGGEKKKRRKVLVYNMRTLLGQEKLAELRKNVGNGIFDREVVVLKRKKMTVDLQMKLWKLQGYVAEHSGLLDASGRASMIGDDYFEDDDLEDGDLENEDEHS